MDLTLIVASLVSVAVLTWLMRTVRPEAELRGDARVVAYGRPWRWVLVALTLFGLAMAGELALPSPVEDGVIAGLAVATALYGALVGVAWWEVARRELHLREDGLTVHWPFGRKGTYAWGEVQQVRHLKSMMALELRFADRRTFWAYTSMSGLRDLGAALRERAPAALEPSAHALLAPPSSP